MSTSRRIAFGAFAHWVIRGVTIVLGLVLMPILLKHLPKEEVGIWLLLGQSWAVLGILDLGFGSILTRRIALAKGKSGGSPHAVLNAVSLGEIRDLVACGRRIYRFMAAGVFAVAWSLGFFYLRNLELQTLSHPVVWTAWTILCACQAITVWSSIWTCLLLGMGNVGWDGLLTTLISGLTMLMQIGMVFLGGGIVALASIATEGALAQVYLVHRFARGRSPEVFHKSGRWNPAVLKGVPGLALRAWLSALGTVLVFNTDGFFIASEEGANNIPAFRAAFLVVLNVHILASVFAQSSFVFISQLWQAGEKEAARRIFQRNLQLGLCFMLCGSAAILFAGESLFNAWLGAGNYIGQQVVGVFVLLYVLEQQSFIISSSCRSTDYEPFAIWMMTGGLLKLAIALPMIERFGLLGLALATLIAQLSTAHWFVAKRGLSRLEFSFSRYIRTVLIPCAFVFTAACGLAFLATSLAPAGSDWIKLLAASGGAGLALAAAFWRMALETHHRDSILAKILRINRARI